LSHKGALAALSRLSEPTLGVFRAEDARDVSAKQLASLRAAGLVVREFPGVYRMAVVPTSNEQRLRAALLWAGPTAVVAGASAGELYGFEGIAATKPEFVVPRDRRVRSASVVAHHVGDRRALMVRDVRGFPATGVEATLVSLAHCLDADAFEIACEDARRRRLTSVAAMTAYLDRWGRRGRPGIAATRALVRQLDPVHPSRSTLEVLTRRLLVAHGRTHFEREYPLAWNGRTYFFDFAFVEQRTILETNGRRWHDDPVDYERDNEKWSVPGRHGYRLVFATWNKVTRDPMALLAELDGALAAA
jgi:very-short-patch-repair endonuclease